MFSAFGGCSGKCSELTNEIDLGCPGQHCCLTVTGKPKQFWKTFMKPKIKFLLYCYRVLASLPRPLFQGFRNQTKSTKPPGISSVHNTLISVKPFKTLITSIQYLWYSKCQIYMVFWILYTCPSVFGVHDCHSNKSSFSFR